MNRTLAVFLLLILIPLGAALGYVAGPGLARTNYTVSLAARVWAEERQALEDRTLESDAFRQTGGGDRAALFAHARTIERRFRWGGALLGVWGGLVLGLHFFGLASPTRRTEFEVEHARCVSCARCYRWCPRERLRLAHRETGPPGGTPNESGEQVRRLTPEATP